MTQPEETPEADTEETVSRRKRHVETKAMDAILAILDDLPMRARGRVIGHVADICEDNGTFQPSV